MKVRATAYLSQLEGCVKQSTLAMHLRNHPPLRRGSTRVCLGDTRIAGGVLVVSVVNGELKEVCSAKVRKLGERVGQAWRLHVHPQDSSRAAYVNRKGEVKWCRS